MTQKSLVYMVLAVAVGYMLVSAVPQQVAMYTTPQNMLSVETDSLDMGAASDDNGEAVPELGDTPSDLNTFEHPRGGFEEPSFLETSQLPWLMKWWTLDIVIAITIYWVARRRLL